MSGGLEELWGKDTTFLEKKEKYLLVLK
jgi:hypothetical protein